MIDGHDRLLVILSLLNEFMMMITVFWQFGYMTGPSNSHLLVI